VYYHLDLRECYSGLYVPNRHTYDLRYSSGDPRHIRNVREAIRSVHSALAAFKVWVELYQVLGFTSAKTERARPMTRRVQVCDVDHDAISELAHGLVQRIVVALGVGPGVLRAGRGGQGVQHLGHYRGALRGQVATHNSRAAEGGLQPYRAVVEFAVRIAVGSIGPGPGGHLASQFSQASQVHPGPRSADQDRVGGITAVLRELVGPLAHGASERLRYLPLGQRLHDQGVGGGTADPCLLVLAVVLSSATPRTRRS